MFHSHPFCFIIFVTMMVAAGFKSREQINADSVNVLLETAYALEATAPDTAIALYKQAYELALEAGDTLNAGRSLQYAGIVFSEHDDPDSAFYYYHQALSFFQKINYQKGIGSTYINLGNLSQFRADYTDAIDYYLQGIPYFEQLKDTSSILITYNNIGSVFSFIHQPQRALSYYDQALQMGKSSEDSVRMADTYINMSKVYIMLQDTAQAIDKLQQVIQYSEPQEHVYFLMLANNNLAELYMDSGDIEKALPYAFATVNYARQHDMPYYIASALLTAARALIVAGDFLPALDTLKKGMQLGEAIKSNDIRSYAYQLTSQAYEGLGDYYKAHEHLLLHKILSDSIFNEAQNRALHELERKFQAEKKSRQLVDQQLLNAQQEETLSQQRFLLSVVILVSLLLALAAGFLLYYLRQRRKLYHQQLMVVKRENELQSVKALITGEEKERTRIAKELHDGLSGLLSGIKLRFSAFKDYIGGEDQQHNYRQALGLLDDASREVRQISHNLMPEVLLKYGLIEALHGYFNSINQSGTLQIDFQVLGMEQRLSSSMELTLYRILQELVKNIIKHSNATEVLVQMSRIDHLLTVTVEDNGIGFSPDRTDDGIGLESIRSRVDYLSGKLDIQSQQGMGTSVYIEFTFEKLQSV